MATATKSRRLGAHVRDGGQEHGHEGPHAGDSAQFSDEERTAAGLPPIGEGPGGPQQQSERARRNVERRARFEHEADEYERTTAAKPAPAAPTRSVPRRSLGSQASDTAKTAGSGLSGLLRGKGGGTVAGTALGFVAFALFRAILNGGPAEAKGWLAAKFINEPYTGGVPVPTAPAKPHPAIAVPASSGQPASTVAA